MPRYADEHLGWSFRHPDGTLDADFCSRDGAIFYMCLAYKNRNGYAGNCVESPQDNIGAKAAGYRLQRVKLVAI